MQKLTTVEAIWLFHKIGHAVGGPFHPENRTAARQLRGHHCGDHKSIVGAKAVLRAP
jgi:hypothetical protein